MEEKLSIILSKDFIIKKTSKKTVIKSSVAKILIIMLF
jgi:hypothetical protein